MPKLLRILVTGISFLAYSFFGMLLSYVFLPLALIGVGDQRERIRRAQRLLHRAAAMYLATMRIMGLYRMRHLAVLPAPLAEGRGAVIVANHPCLLDILFIVAELPEVSFLAKASWFRNPLIAPILRRTAAIPGPPENREPSPMDGALVLDAMLRHLERGISVVIFPEGTRSPARDLGRFQKGAFEAAMRAGAPLVALKITVDPPTLLKGQPWYDVPDRRVHVGLDLLELVTPEHFPESARILCRRVRGEYQAALGLGTAEITPKLASPATATVVPTDSENVTAPEVAAV